MSETPDKLPTRRKKRKEITVEITTHLSASPQLQLHFESCCSQLFCSCSVWQEAAAKFFHYCSNKTTSLFFRIFSMCRLTEAAFGVRVIYMPLFYNHWSNKKFKKLSLFNTVNTRCQTEEHVKNQKIKFAH